MDRPSPPSATEDSLIRTALALAARLDVAATCDAILSAVEQMFGARSGWILLHDPDTGQLHTAAFQGPGSDTYAELSLPCDCGIVGLAFSRGETVFVPDVQQEDRWFNPERVHHSGLHSVFTMPLKHDEETIGVVGLDSPRFTADAPPTAADLTRLRAIAAMAAIGIKNARLFQAAEEDRVRLRRLLQERRTLRNEVGQLREELRDVTALRAMVGESTALRQVLSQIEIVGPSDSTVLLVGETGTGKELVARAIHERSRRARSALVAVNCAALLESLVESELFGHEKGAFTGAVARKLGQFELADRGTVFLDEIGDLPFEAQAKLLRVLQEREVQRVGGVRPIPVNVRLIAATNQDLAKCMDEGRFRTDLYYRLNVFPIYLPPLRERQEDIPALVTHFVRHFAERLNKPVPRVLDDAMDQLRGYDWPGNIRELQNVMERAVLLSRGQVIRGNVLPGHGDRRPAPIMFVGERASNRSARTEPANILPFSEAERHAILRALESAGWRISGNRGAAALLGLKATTLHAKMKKLGIRRPSVRSA